MKYAASIRLHPMIASDDIQKGLELLIKEKPKFVFFGNILSFSHPKSI